MRTNGSAMQTPDFDVVVVGAGFAGLYMLKRARDAGLRTVVLEAADGVGGTWYWNRYPGARCDIQSIDYSYSFDPELDDEWEWSEKYATQPEILRYVNHVADKHDLKRDIRFATRVTDAVWDDAGRTWSLRTESADGTQGDTLTCRWYVMATGCLSVPKEPDIAGIANFTGALYATSRWPHEGVDFTGQRVGVIGTGSSGIQSIPIIAEQAEQLTVFQRTPNFSFPAHNGPVPGDKLDAIRSRRDEYREEARWSGIGVPAEPPAEPMPMLSEEERNRRFEWAWEQGELVAVGSPAADLFVNPASNEVYAEFVRGKIRSVVEDPATAELLCPTDHPVGTKRPCLDTGYFATFNRPNVRLVDLRSTPIEEVTGSGLRTPEESFEFDAIVLATGFDAMTGAIVGVDITGRHGETLKAKWDHGPQTYLGLMSEGFPNLFMITGPQSPSVLSNMMVSIEQHVDWITDCIEALRADGLDTIEPTELAESMWVQHNNDRAAITLYPHANSWYMGANVPGKPRVFLPYVGGVGRYRQVCDDVVAQGYLGFRRSSGEGTEVVNDGVIRRMQPDVEIMLEVFAELGLPSYEELPVEGARAMSEAAATQRPPGPAVGEQVDGTLPGADGSPLQYRLYRPATPGPHPVVVYFHGGGWVIGGFDSDEPLCRDLCVRSGAMVISVDYRHAPEHRFPAAAEDGFAALRWIAEHAVELGGLPGQLAVAGWSAGANVAASACQMARDAGAPHISGQVLICPVTDSDMTRPSYTENAEGYLLTRKLMEWFWDHYCDPADRQDPRVAVLRGDLSALPPALVVTCELDPLRDEGQAYAEALAAAGVDVRHLPCRGQMHTSIPGVDTIISATPIRAEIAAELSRMVRTGDTAPV